MAGTAQLPDAASSRIAAVIVLAAGAGTRMRSSLPKVLHPIAGKPLIWHAAAAAGALSPQHLVAVLGHGRDRVQEFLAAAGDLPPVTIAVQDEQLGTGHATSCALAALDAVPEGTVIVSYGDVPLLRAETLAALADEHQRSGNAVTVLTATVADPTGYGRIVRDESGALAGIVEQKDADAAQRAITEINSGVYAFDGAVLAEALPRVGSANSQGEQYLTDVVGLARGDGRRVGSLHADDPMETEGVNDRVQLAQLARVLNDRIIRSHQLAGVTIHDPATTWIHADVAIGQDTEILPGTSLEAGTVVGAGASIGPDSTLSACTVGDGARVVRSHCLGAAIGVAATVGPYSYLRPGADLGEGAHVGAHVEIKKSTIGAGAKVPHLSYIGDATIGAGSNIGAGSITANYDGVGKFPTTIGENAFVGTNSTLVAPVTVADGAYIGAGSTVTDEVPAGALAVARGRQHNSDGWVLRRRTGTASETSARAAGATDRDTPSKEPSA
ncbi:bifunctional UDP-N-acetylglucosamine diphosphorylase/glucosamine-1-phosphate N-acetyltransferase GlmU [Nakamurella lactea]|uniref:bifunctional UDP-N-acetylglucosamine diphosphorylase/glucosamine-1-phosphate N-acetyltransferase GlmU n=1 Tax=Nakamurella lactea TaxID=459515 RepID=UPI0004025888|nr:bifunctional UDP-N-acetylglucosamine diphosphorylase/glucosamine-1-phosphate N-acetyltransferase GlmU [Nakamurella lactea]